MQEIRFTIMDATEQKLWLQSNCKSEFKSYTFPSSVAQTKEGDEYIGEVKEDKANGKGIYNWEKGYQYFGDWIDDKPQGNGVLIYPDGRKYEGEFLNAKRDGKGILYWPNGDIYEGEFSKGNRDGKAEFLFLDGTIFFEGSYVDNFSEGIGIMKSKRGDLYKGDFKKGKRNGQGKYLWVNGRMYQGDFSQGQRTGSAIFIEGITVKDVKHSGHPLVLADIPEYIRQIGDDWIIYFQYNVSLLDSFKLLETKAQLDISTNYLQKSKIIAYRDGDDWYNDTGDKVCDIEFPYKNHKLLNDAADGKIGPLGNLYNGEWKDAKKHGEGIFYWISNNGITSYKGNWELGKRTGKGVLTYALESWSEYRKEYDGEWKDNMRHGYGKMTWKTGDEIGANKNMKYLDSYLGQWRDNKPHGKGKMTYENPRSPKYDYGPIGGVYEGEWKFGERDGFGTFISEEGWTYQGLWKEGRRHGKGVVTYSNGRKEESIWINDAKGTSLKEQFEEFILRYKDVFKNNSDFLKIEIYFTKEYSLNLKYLQGQPKGDIVYNLHEICSGIEDLLDEYDAIFEDYFNKPCLGKEISSIYFSDRLDDGDIEFGREYCHQK